MPHLPDLAAFCQFAEGYDLAPVYRRLVSDTLTPVSAFRRLDDGGAACLFESVIGGEKVGRYSIVAGQPYLQMHAHRERVTLQWEDGRQEQQHHPDPLEVLRQHLASRRVAPSPELPPFVGGAVGYAGYDVVRYVEHLPHAPQDDRGLADMSFGFYDRLIVFDHVTKTIFAIALARLDRHATWEAARRDAEQRIDQWVELLQQPPEGLALADIDPSGDPHLPTTSNFTPQAFQAAVGKCVEYIRAGDIFQVVLSQRLKTEITCDPFEIYRTLRVINPSPFMFFLRTPEVTLVGSLARDHVPRGRRASHRAPPGRHATSRGDRATEDRRLAEELLADPKERAEHVMLVDLGRNDVGRVAALRDASNSPMSWRSNATAT